MATGIPLNKMDNNEFKFTIQYTGKMSEQDILSLESRPINNVLSVNADDENSTWVNKLFFGDNLDVLLNLVKDENIRGKVKLVYIDPPYATNSLFRCREQKDAYLDNLKGSHFLEFLRKRFILLRELLSSDGSIYVHLDEKMAFPVKLILDEVFGENNYRNFITRQKCNRKNTTRNQYGNISDYIMFYTKSSKYTWNRAYEPWTEEDMKKQYPCMEEGTGRRYKKVPIHAPGVRNGETGKEWRGMLPPPGKHWQYLPSKLEQMDQDGEIYWSPTGNPRRKVYFENSEGIPVQDIWMDLKDITNQNDKITGYPTEKNIKILDRIVKASSNEGDIVLDCFAGSGTTLVSAEINNRRWIGIDESFHAIDTMMNRFANGSKTMGDYVNTNEQVHMFDGPGLLLGSMWDDYSSLEDYDNKKILVTTLKMLDKRLTKEWLLS